MANYIISNKKNFIFAIIYMIIPLILTRIANIKNSVVDEMGAVGLTIYGLYLFFTSIEIEPKT